MAVELNTLISIKQITWHCIATKYKRKIDTIIKTICSNLTPNIEIMKIRVISYMFFMLFVWHIALTLQS